MTKKLNLLVIMMFSSVILFAQENLPGKAEPGKCYVKCITKNEYKTVTEAIEVYPAYTKLEVVPATYKTVEERVIVKEASKKFVYVPAVYETEEVSYIKQESSSDLKIIPASFTTGSKTVEVYPKTGGWEYKEITCDSPNKDDCVAACFIEYPAQFRNVNYTALVKDATVSNEKTPQSSGSYKKRVIKTPARVDEIEIPAEYKTIKKLVVDSPAITKNVKVPAQYKEVSKTIITKKGGITTWEEVDCELLDANILPIFYELGSARLTPASKRTIDETLLPLLKSKPISIEIMSHTDSRGHDNFNIILSQQRANSVVNYLASKGISKSRLSAKGYGESRLVNRCENDVDCSENEHQKNRRTEFRVLEN
ncbi:OmpA family protein [Tamlana sp. 2201CG12-4]|uniref:OmpA family protein n=1 Tax=Tamlana sp. 2201CG12-4 TaxID=3112582 RepID=UPI002DBFDF78|nr:OmpA family protein [Tamlana sp. 2201CG12-4]MEC3908724.1 OmpA family protein [Tamlana sp. 2201CG12-4]